MCFQCPFIPKRTSHKMQLPHLSTLTVHCFYRVVVSVTLNQAQKSKIHKFLEWMITENINLYSFRYHLPSRFGDDNTSSPLYLLAMCVFLQSLLNPSVSPILIVSLLALLVCVNPFLFLASLPNSIFKDLNVT